MRLSKATDWKALSDILQHARANPGKLRVGIDAGSSAQIFAAAFVDKAGFLARIGRPHTLTNFRAPDVSIQRVGDLALIHASFEDTRPDGGHGRGRYTDIWQRRNGRWLCVSAHFTRC